MKANEQTIDRDIIRREARRAESQARREQSVELDRRRGRRGREARASAARWDRVDDDLDENVRPEGAGEAGQGSMGGGPAWHK